MHLEETYTGIMRVASNRDGKPYKDWREYYVDQSGLIMIFQSDSKPGKYAVYFFLPSDEYMHSSCGKLQIQGMQAVAIVPDPFSGTPQAWIAFEFYR